MNLVVSFEKSQEDFGPYVKNSEIDFFLLIVIILKKTFHSQFLFLSVLLFAAIFVFLFLSREEEKSLFGNKSSSETSAESELQ
jgi:hypothetical protein